MSIVLFCFMLCLLCEALFNKTSVTFKRWQTIFLHLVLKKMCSSSHPEWNCWWDMRENKRWLGWKSFSWDNFLDLSFSGCIHALQRRRRDSKADKRFEQGFFLDLWILWYAQLKLRDSSKIWMGNNLSFSPIICRLFQENREYALEIT